MADHRRLAAVSAAQLACGIVGLLIAVRRRHAFDLPLLQGNPERVARDAATLGTALSAPMPMLAAQATLTVRAARSDDPRAIRRLNALGLAMVAGSLGERLVRRRLRPHGWDPMETPVVAAAVGLSAAMALLGRGSRRALTARRAWNRAFRDGCSASMRSRLRISTGVRSDTGAQQRGEEHSGGAPLPPRRPWQRAPL